MVEVVVFVLIQAGVSPGVIPIYPEAILVPAPRIKEIVVRNPMVTFCPMEIRVKMTTENANTKTAQIVYSARKKASAPANIASYVSYYVLQINFF